MPRLLLLLLFFSLLSLVALAHVYLNQVTTKYKRLKLEQECSDGLCATSEKAGLKKDCVDAFCKEHLSERDERLYNQCLRRIKKFAGPVVPKNSGCHFISASHPPVGLVSFPGSGNTWVRQMLEAASGVCTGSVMCDMSLRFAGFTGENINSGSVLVVKTHNSTPNWATDAPIKSDTGDTRFHSAIVIIRNPLDALVSEWNRRVANGFSIPTRHLRTHTKQISKKYFRWNKRWNEFIHHQSEQWREIVQLWVIGGLKAGKQVMVVHYEELQRARNTQIIRMLKFLKQSTSKQLMQKFNTFHRQHSNEFEPYTNQQKSYVLSVVQDTIKDLAQNNMQSQINLTQYL